MTKTQCEAAIAEYEDICEKGYTDSKSIEKLSYSHWLDSPWKGFFEDDEGKYIWFFFLEQYEWNGTN